VTGYQEFKQLRKDTGYTIRSFAEKAGISSRSQTSYENGSLQLIAMSVDKCIRIFHLLDQDIPEFYYKNYLLKEEVDEQLAKWQIMNLQTVNFMDMRVKLCNRLNKIRQRHTIDEPFLNQIVTDYNLAFEQLEAKVREDGSISSEDYALYIQPILYRIRWGNEQPRHDEFGSCVNDKLFMTDYTYKDIARFIGITSEHLKHSIYGRYDYRKMHIGVALKLCYVLNGKCIKRRRYSIT
jgi:transcriptional regulator with XRE-family HTH domain